MMAYLRTLASKIAGLFRRPHFEKELDAEIREHLASLEERFAAQGMSREEARRAARRAFGGVEQLKEVHRDHYSFAWLDHTNRDFRFALRSLRKNPGFTLVAVMTL